MTYQIRLQTCPNGAKQQTSATSLDTRALPRAQISAQRKRAATVSATRHSSHKPNGSSVRTKTTELHGQWVSQHEVPGAKSTSVGSRKSSFKYGPNSGISGTHRSGDHWTKLHGAVANESQVAPPALGDTVEVNHTFLPERRYLKPNATPSVRNVITRSAPGASQQSFRVKDRREMSRIKADRLQASRLACLLAKEAAVVSARQKVLERREAKLATLRERMKLRHQQAEARRKALEQATKERLLQLSQHRHCVTVSHHHSDNYQVSPLRTPAQFRSLRLTSRPTNVHSERRPIVAFGSSTPRMICFTSRELQALYCTNCNSSCPADSGPGPSDIISTSGICIRDSVRSRNSYSLNRSVRSTSPWMRPMRRENSDQISSATDKSFSSSRGNNWSSDRSLLDYMQKSKENTIEYNTNRNNTNRMTASVVHKPKPKLEKTMRSASISVKRLNTCRSLERTGSNHLSRKPSSKTAPHGVTKPLMIRSQDLDTRHRGNNIAMKPVTRKSVHTRLTKHNSLTHSGMASLGISSKPKTSQIVNPSTSVVKCVVDPHVRSTRRLSTKQKSDQTSDKTEAYRAKVQQQRRKAREEMNQTKSTELDQTNSEVVDNSEKDPSLKPVASQPIEDVSNDAVHQAGDLVPESEPISPVPDSQPKLTAIEPLSPQTRLNSPQSDSSLSMTTNVPSERDDTQPTELSTGFHSGPISHPLNSDSRTVSTLLNGQEFAERESRKRRLEGIMARVKPLNSRSESRHAEVRTVTSPASLLATDSHKVTTSTTNELFVSPIRVTSPAEMVDGAQSPTSGHLNDPVFSNDSVVRPAADASNVSPGSTADLTAHDRPGSEMTIMEQAMSATPSPPTNSWDSKRANVVSNLLASGRLNAQSRAAKILLNMASGRSATEGLVTQNYANTTSLHKMLPTDPYSQKRLTPDLTNGVTPEHMK